MDADDGLDLDPYSPVGSTNTEMEELFNSPPRAEPTPKAAKGARNRLSGAGRKRLKHYKAKGLPIEQALAMAKQPLPNPLKRPKAGDSLKRGRSANTTPENNMPKRGSAKPGAGATPASVPELKAAPADEQAEQRAVTSAKKFPSGYPKALLSTKELSAVQEAILDVIRTQRQGAVKPFFTGCTFRPGWLLISCANRETADWLKAAMPKLKLWPGAKVELVADADMPKPQVYIGHFPKTEKYSNEDILQLLEGQNSALRTGDWRILNRGERGKQIELTFAVDPNSDEKLKSVGHRLCYGFGQSGSALLLASSTMAAPTANASAATTERPAHNRSPGCARPYMVGSKQPWEEEGRSWPEQGLMAHSTLPSTHNNIRHLKCLQANLHHAKAASDVLCCRFTTEDLSVAFLQEPWILSAVSFVVGQGEAPVGHAFGRIQKKYFIGYKRTHRICKPLSPIE
ncbi:hypothetical protein ACLKA6_002567 [Drosophila palustris]